MDIMAKTAVAVAALSLSADRLIASHSNNSDSLSSLQADVAAADDSISASLNDVRTKIDAAVPADGPVGVSSNVALDGSGTTS